MNPFKLFYFRSVQFVLNKIAKPFINFREPELIKGPGSYVKVADVLKEKGFKKPLIVAGPTIEKIGLLKPLTDRLEELGLSYVKYLGVEPNPTFNSCIPAVELAKKEGTDSIIAFGGGSNMDAAKIIGACLSRNTTDIAKFKGLFKVRKKYNCLIAIPTTAGTGSEVTVAAVIIDPTTRRKYSVSDPNLIPDYAVLDESLLASLPPHVIAACGMDALTHAVEAYVGNATTKKTRKAALDSINMICHNLIGLYQDPHNLAAAKNMLYASYLAGIAITNSYVGYVHALAHQIGGKYNVSHGYANAIILPYVLEAYDKKAYKKLNEIAKMLELVHPESNDKAGRDAFIQYIKMLNIQLDIPSTLKGVIKNEDLDELAKNAVKEANPFYPVPKILEKNELIALYKKIDPTCKGE
ncbi:MAG: iron-containing alcohol dehydrogenase [Bacilli bacterium]|nr:iron-containing alcohol dehydrogenase [Bacilli bacterium]